MFPSTLTKDKLIWWKLILRSHFYVLFYSCCFLCHWCYSPQIRIHYSSNQTRNKHLDYWITAAKRLQPSEVRPHSSLPFFAGWLSLESQTLATCSLSQRAFAYIYGTSDTTLPWQFLNQQITEYLIQHCTNGPRIYRAICTMCKWTTPKNHSINADEFFWCFKTQCVLCISLTPRAFWPSLSSAGSTA